MKKCLKAAGLLFALVLAFCVMPAAVFADGTTADGLKYRLDDSTKTITITGYEGTNPKVTIPAVIGDTYPVTRIGSSAFEGNKVVTDVTFAPGSKVETINGYAFENCKTLKSITFPPSLKEITSQAFHGCSSLTSVVIPEGVTKLGYGYYHGVFEDCTSLTSVQLPSTLTEIAWATFRNCPSLKTVNIPSGLTTLGDSAFWGTAITSVELPDGITRVGEWVFRYCTSLKTVKLSDNVKTIDTGAFEGCTSLTSINIPKDLTRLDGSTFRGCSSLRSLEFGDAVTSVEGSDFADCPKLNVRVVKGSKVETVCINNDIPFTVYAFSLGGCSIEGITEKTYTGKPIQQDPVITDGSTKLVNGTHYVLEYTNNINAGTATVKITGTGNYVGTVEKTFRITPEDISKCRIKLAKTTLVYNTNYQEPKVTVTFNGQVVDPVNNYYVSYSSNRYAGTAWVTVSGKGNFKESKKASFKIVPKAVKLKKLKATSRGFKASWKKNDIQTTGYQLQYSLKKNFKGAKTVTIKNNQTVSKSISRLKAKKTYYVRIRCYYRGSGKYYSAWSKALRVKTKK